ncbi:hypothetical protein JVU11DRAFT_12129 [Chiua virens]|nr:hypothetical protein JVU11DRAFT_12129 [Chiua virens]
MVKALHTSSGRVKMTVMATNGTSQTSVATLSCIHKDCIGAERKLMEEAVKAICLQQCLVEAQLEVGDFSEYNCDDMAWDDVVDDPMSNEYATGADYAWYSHECYYATE